MQIAGSAASPNLLLVVLALFRHGFDTGNHEVRVYKRDFYRDKRPICRPSAICGI